MSEHTDFRPHEAADAGSTGSAASPSPVHQLQARIEQTYARRKLNGIDDSTPAAACLKPLLVALDWTGEARHLEEALPHFDQVRNIDDVRALLARLNYHSEGRPLKQTEIRAGMLPCLYLPKGADNVLVVLGFEPDGRLLIFDGARKCFRTLRPEATRGMAYQVRHVCRKEANQTLSKYGYVQTLFGKFRRTLATLFLMTFAINVLALTVPVYTMNVYDKAIGAKSPMTLFYLFVAIAILVGAELGLRTARTRVIAFLGARFESLLSIGAFEKLLNLSAGMTESAPISAQLTRLKQFEGVRELFTGALGNAIFDLPFAAVFLATIFIIAGPLGFVPVALFAVFLIMAAVTIPLTRNHVRKTGEAKTRGRNFLMELTEKHRIVRHHAAENIWIDRFKEISSDYLIRQYKAQQLNNLLQTISQALVMVAGVLTVGLGALFVLWGELTVGALIAVVALVWRLLSPLQAVFLGLNRVGRTLETFKQINNMMRLETERQPGQLPTFYRSFHGRIELLGVGFRYGPLTEPAIRGIALEIPAGQIVAVVGDSGAGKSTLLKLAAGLYQPQMGVVRIDGLDLRQIDVAELRQAIGYAPQKPEFFYGTIAQNFRLADPTATPEAMRRALEDAGAAGVVATLPDGIDTRLKSVDRRSLPGGFMQQLALARAYLKNGPITLLDDPGSRLDRAGDEVLLRKLDNLRGRSTTILVTHRPSHMRAADRVIVLQQGMVAADGPPEEIVPALMNQIKKAG